MTLVDGAPATRVLLASADEVASRHLLLTLTSGGLAVEERALDGAGLLRAARVLRGPPADGMRVVLADGRLPGLEAALPELTRLGVGVVVAGPVAPSWAGVVECVEGAPTVEQVAQAVRRAAARDPLRVARRIPNPRQEEQSTGGRLVAVTSPHGAPGKTTVATSLAASLALGGSTAALCDLDLRGGNVGVFLGLQPQFNLFQVAGALGAGRDPRQAVDGELQEVRPRLRVLGGLASPAAMLGEITPALVACVLARLRATNGWTVADLGTAGEGRGWTVAGLDDALADADFVLVVAEPSPVGLWNLRLALLDGPLAAARDRLGVVLNRQHPRHHHAPAEIAAAFPDVSVLSSLPHEYECTEEALREQRPLAEDRHSDCAKAIRQLAARMQALPAERKGAAA